MKLQPGSEANPLGIPVPKMGDRVLLLGWPDDAEIVQKSQIPGVRLNQAAYETIEQIPVLEPEPDFLHVNGQTITDDQLEALYAERAWDPSMVTVVGRYNSRFQTYAKVRGPWTLAVAWLVALAVLAILFFMLKSFVLGFF